MAKRSSQQKRSRGGQPTAGRANKRARHEPAPPVEEGVDALPDQEEEESFAQDPTRLSEAEREAQARGAASELADLAASTAKGDRIPDDVMRQVAHGAYLFCCAATGMTLRTYQEKLAIRFCESVFLEDGDELTGLFSRQSGKTEVVAVLISGLMVLCPLLAELIPDERCRKWATGIHIGVFAPDYGIVEVILNRVSERLYGRAMREMMADPEIGMDPQHENLTLPNGSLVRGHSTNPRVQIEGYTYHLIFCDETQNIPDWRIRKSIHPMGAATMASILKIGTPRPAKCEFYEACQRNRRHDVQNPGASRRRHFEFDYKACAAESDRYRRYVAKEIDRLGYESDDFRMAYRLHWIMERGFFLPPEQFDECAIERKDVVRVRRPGRTTLRFERPSNTVNFDKVNRHVAGLDIGRSNDSTVATVGRVLWDHPVSVAGLTVYYVHIVNWLELFGDDHEAQYPRITSFLSNYNLDKVLVDATGRGDPICSRLVADLAPFDIPVAPFIFSGESKHLGFSLLLQELRANRITYPAGSACARLAKYRRFRQQFGDLEKTWRGKHMVVEAPRQGVAGKRLKDAHDDYPDSALLMLMATQNLEEAWEAEEAHNPFFGRTARGGRGGFGGRSVSPARDAHQRRDGQWWRR